MLLFICCMLYFIPLKELFTHMETSPLPVKGCKFTHTISTHEQWGFFMKRHLLRLWLSPRTHDIKTCCRTFGSEAKFNDLGLSRSVFEHQTVRMQAERLNRLCHSRNKFKCHCGYLPRFWHLWYSTHKNCLLFSVYLIPLNTTSIRWRRFLVY